MKKAYRIRLLFGIFILALAIFGFFGLFYPVKIFDIQFAPAFQRTLVDFSIVSALIPGAIILLTLIFGRFYCSTLCPFGILQEIFALVFKKENKSIKSYPVKYFIAALTFGVLIGGSALLIRYIEPYTYFSSGLSLSIFGLCAFFTVLFVLFFKNRFFCTNICPTGTILGLLSKFSINKIYINKEVCVSCKMCEKKCPAGCINSKEKTVDNEICVRCLKCLEVCRLKGIKFGIKPEEKVKFSLKRRQTILALSVFALFSCAIKAGIALKDRTYKKIKDIILPPGALSGEEFERKCFNCNLCVNNCPNKIIKKADEEYSFVHLDFEKGFCDKNCNRCATICPTGAIRHIDLEEKQKTRIALAMIKEEECTKCGLCAKICPYGAITLEEEKIPKIDGSKCAGCGKCRALCHFGAIDIFGVKKQSLI